MQFLYTTDLHGDITRYEKVYDYAIDCNIKLIHLGADLLPKGSDIAGRQKEFVKKYLKNFYYKCQERKIKVLAFFGNDDLYTRKIYFKQYGELLDEVPYHQEGFEFKAYQYVQDYPFGLKTATKRDSEGWKCPDPYISKPVEYTKKGWEEIKDIEKYFAEKGTIEQDLKNIDVNNKTIIAIHQPPLGLDLDVCIDGRRVGSQSVFNFIKEKQPLCVLCGHIHESYHVSGIWKTTLGKTTIIQPGQRGSETTMVLINIEKEKVDSYLIKI
jgi:Icc-related predicted phosphoesterase